MIKQHGYVEKNKNPSIIEDNLTVDNGNNAKFSLLQTPTSSIDNVYTYSYASATLYLTIDNGKLITIQVDHNTNNDFDGTYKFPILGDALIGLPTSIDDARAE